MTIGVKLDAGKPRPALLPWDGVAAVVDVLEYGAHKYAPGNWRKVPDAKDRYLNAALRHLHAHASGVRLDAESKLPHLAHAACCLLFLLELEAARESVR